MQVEFAKNWQKDVNSNSTGFKSKPTAEDMQKIKDGLAELMHEVFLEELAKHGYTVVDAAAEDTLHVRTAIIDLWVNAPDSNDPGITRTYTTSAGSMTLVLEARDGPTGQLLARAVDGRSDDTPGGTVRVDHEGFEHQRRATHHAGCGRASCARASTASTARKNSQRGCLSNQVCCQAIP